MEKILLLLIAMFVFGCNAISYAEGAGYTYADGGIIYSNVTTPLSLPKARDIDANGGSIIVPLSDDAKNNLVDINKLKTSKSKTTNLLWLVEFGDAGICKTAKKGNIKTIHYVEFTNEKAYVPLIFFPIYCKNYTTTVYGE